MRSSATFLVLMASCLVAPAGATPPAVTTGVAEGGSDVVTLEPLWSRGGDDDPDVMFGIPCGVTQDPEGHVYVLDNQLSEIVMFSPDGEYLRTLGREGEGPGEFRRPNGLVILPDGAVAAANMIRARFERLTSAGVPDGSFALGDDGPQEGVVVLYGAVCRGGTLVGATTTSAYDQATARMHRVQNLDIYHPDGRLRARLREASLSMSFDGTGEIHERHLLRSFQIGRAHV
jgi:hypothetical protein